MIVRMCEYKLVNNGSYQQTFGDWLSADEQTNAWGDGKCPPPPKRTDTMDLFLLTTTKNRCDDSGNGADYRDQWGSFAFDQQL